MTGIVLKFSYNNIGETPVTGGICGSFFFIRPNLIVTANHVLNRAEFKPNEGYEMCQYWLIAQPDIVIELTPEMFIEHPEIDATFIRLDSEYQIEIRNLSSNSVSVGQECYNEGFIGGQMPNLGVTWSTSGLVITSCNYGNTIANGEGSIKSLKNMNINAADIKMNNVKGYETSYGGVQGMSGGPLIDKESNEIIGLMSIGLPADVAVKTSLFAVTTEELNERIKNIV